MVRTWLGTLFKEPTRTRAKLRSYYGLMFFRAAVLWDGMPAGCMFMARNLKAIKCEAGRCKLTPG